MHAFAAALLVFAIIAQQAFSQEGRNTRPIKKPLVFASQAEKDAYDEKTKPTGDGKTAGKTPPLKNAGRPMAKIMAHIIGGNRATRGQMPWIVGLVLNSASFCGGSLITQGAVLTAAHCAKKVKRFTVYIGMQNYGSKTETGRVVMTATKRVVHKGFSKSMLENDIAIIKLPKRVTIGQYINTVKLPTYSDVTKKFVGTKATIAGWGLTSDSKLKSFCFAAEFFKINALKQAESARS
ncbi:Hypothetical predicted protein [Cloeon dipterum]|uniref:Peptidase S1 domain-containing protein n=1 Tax=Cloeon dipterum TaxID=197152 RepID=A0A8S1CKP5_9INSE|nr:Hypothetical predicted protein [Cloeon dipterum]